jgi:hypothetical protein
MNQPNETEIRDTYEAAYYMLNGARLIRARRLPVSAAHREKYLSAWRWILTLENVPPDFQTRWRQRQAFANIRELAQVRMKIKRFMRNNVI